LTQQYQHLSPNAKAMLDKSNAERIEAIRQEKWINYPAADRILADFEQLLIYPKRDRMPCRLLIAESNNGKTSLLRKFRRGYPADPNIEGDAANIPVLFAILNGPDERMIYRELLKGLFEQIPHNPKPGDLQDQLISVLLRVKPKMIMLDEVNTLITGTTSKTQACFNALKYITNRTGIPIVAAGTREALNGFKTDPQIENRFEPRRLELWGPGKELQVFLKAYEYLTPLQKPSNLWSKTMTEDIRHKTNGLIGEIASLISTAATYAIGSGEEQITESVLNNCGYVPIHRRKQMR
jgi:hypothetical protein